MQNIQERIWASASAIEAELDARRLALIQAPTDLEITFNGGIAPDVGRHYAQILIDQNLPKDAQVLDLGCGYGRIAMALAPRLGREMRYVGLDPNEEGVNWAQRNITPHFPNVIFGGIDVRSQPYNPSGNLMGSGFRFPFADESLDLVFMISVLTHVDMPTVENYVLEASRTLKPNGRLVATMFLIDPEVDRLLSDGKGTFTMAVPFGASRVEVAANPELAIAHPRKAVLEIIQRAGFVESEFRDGYWCGRASATPMDFQDLVVASRSKGQARPLDLVRTMPDVSPTPWSQEVCDEVARLTGQEENRIASFLTWSNLLALNILWWNCDGLELGMREPVSGSVEACAFGLASLRELGLKDLRPEGSAEGQFYALDDAAMVGLLARSDQAVSRSLLHQVLLEAAEIGLRIHASMQSGNVPVLLARDRNPVDVSIKGFC